MTTTMTRATMIPTSLNQRLRLIAIHEEMTLKDLTAYALTQWVEAWEAGHAGEEITL